MRALTTEEAYAKLNLSLDVTGLLPGGFHSMRMVMQSVSLCDTVTVSVEKGSGVIQAGSDVRFLPRGEKNLAGKAALAFREKTELRDLDISVHIKKRIPVCAGMGGGSSDAAAVLRALNRICGTGLSVPELCRIGEGVGSDVPYCVLGGTALAEGRGEILTPLSPFPRCFVVICKPGFQVSTPELFRCIDDIRLKVRPDTEGLLHAIREGKLREAASRFYNVFEEVLPKGGDTVRGIREKLYDFGTLGAVMSGTGPTVFGVFSDRDSAENAYTSLRKEYRECYLAETV